MKTEGHEVLRCNFLHPSSAPPYTWCKRCQKVRQLIRRRRSFHWPMGGFGVSSALQLRAEQPSGAALLQCVARRFVTCTVELAAGLKLSKAESYARRQKRCMVGSLHCHVTGVSKPTPGLLYWNRWATHLNSWRVLERGGESPSSWTKLTQSYKLLLVKFWLHVRAIRRRRWIGSHRTVRVGASGVGGRFPEVDKT